MKIVKCINNDFYVTDLKLGKIYIVEKEYPKDPSNNFSYLGYDLKNVTKVPGGGYMLERFVELKGNINILRILYKIT